MTVRWPVLVAGGVLAGTVGTIAKGKAEGLLQPLAEKVWPPAPGADEVPGADPSDHYEEQDLLTSRRTASGQRIYGEDAIERVRLLRRLLTAGLNSATIATLLPCVDTPSAAVTHDTLGVMHRERARIADQIAELSATREQLSYLIDAATDFHRDQLVPGRTAVPA